MWIIEDDTFYRHLEQSKVEPPTENPQIFIEDTMGEDFETIWGKEINRRRQYRLEMAELEETKKNWWSIYSDPNGKHILENWPLILEKAKAKMSQDTKLKIAYELWIKKLKPYQIQDNTIYVNLFNPSVSKGYIQKQYLHMVEDSVFEILEQKYNVDIIRLFDSCRTFEEYRVLECNKKGYDAIFSLTNMSENQLPKPIYIAGPSYSGKTHLLKALVHYFEKTNTCVLHSSMDIFYEEMLHDVQCSEYSFYKKVYDSGIYDIVIIDDVGHLKMVKGGKVQTEVYKQLLRLHDMGKQIIFAGKPLEEMSDMSEELENFIKSGNYITIGGVETEIDGTTCNVFKKLQFPRA